MTLSHLKVFKYRGFPDFFKSWQFFQPPDNLDQKSFPFFSKTLQFIPNFSKPLCFLWRFKKIGTPRKCKLVFNKIPCSLKVKLYTFRSLSSK